MALFPFDTQKSSRTRAIFRSKTQSEIKNGGQAVETQKEFHETAAQTTAKNITLENSRQLEIITA